MQKIVVFLVGKMSIPFTLLTHMPKHISFLIWSLLLDTWSLEIGSRYSLIEEDETMRVLTIRHLEFGNFVYLGHQIWHTYRGLGHPTFLPFHEHTPWEVWSIGGPPSLWIYTVCFQLSPSTLLGLRRLSC